jgi:hypothetical protein
MASPSPSLVFNTLSHAINEKLTRDNFRLWKALVWPVVHGAQLTPYLDGTKKKPREFINVSRNKTRLGKRFPTLSKSLG